MIRARLIIKGEERERVYRIISPIVTIGRSEHNDIVLLGKFVSKEHARLEVDDNRFFVIDLGKNPSRINGIPVFGSQEIQSGDEIGIGGFRMRFERLDQGDPPEPGTGTAVRGKPAGRSTGRSMEEVDMARIAEPVLELSEETVLPSPSRSTPVPAPIPSPSSPPASLARESSQVRSRGETVVSGGTEEFTEEVDMRPLLGNKETENGTPTTKSSGKSREPILSSPERSSAAPVPVPKPVTEKKPPGVSPPQGKKEEGKKIAPPSGKGSPALEAMTESRPKGTDAVDMKKLLRKVPPKIKRKENPESDDESGGDQKYFIALIVLMAILVLVILLKLL